MSPSSLPNQTAQIIVFFTTARMAQFAAALFRKAGPPYASTLELHSRLSQGQRTASLAKFSAEPRGVLFASDAIARGIDISDVTLIIQVCAWARASYGRDTTWGTRAFVFQAAACK